MIVHLSDRDRALIAEGFVELARLRIAALPDLSSRQVEAACDEIRSRLLAAGEGAADPLADLARARAAMEELERRLDPGRAMPSPSQLNDGFLTAERVSEMEARS